MVQAAIASIPLSASQATALPFLVDRPIAPRRYQVLTAQTLDNALTAALLVFATDRRFVCQPFCFHDRISNHLGHFDPINVTTFNTKIQ